MKACLHVHLKYFCSVQHGFSIYFFRFKSYIKYFIYLCALIKIHLNHIYYLCVTIEVHVRMKKKGIVKITKNKQINYFNALQKLLAVTDFNDMIFEIDMQRDQLIFFKKHTKNDTFKLLCSCHIEHSFAHFLLTESHTYIIQKLVRKKYKLNVNAFATVLCRIHSKNGFNCLFIHFVLSLLFNPLI